MFRIFLISLLLPWLCLARPAIAGSFSIDPVRILLSEARPSAVMRVENRSDAAITVQLQAMSWSQTENHDQLAISRELLATPQVFRLRPGQVQLVRIALLRPVDDSRELAYRLLLDEVPPPPKADFRGLQMALRVSMPVFVQPRATAQPVLSASVIERNGQRQLQLVNRGQSHLQLTGLQLQAARTSATSSATPATAPAATATAAASVLYANDKSVYVLPGQQRELALPANAAWPADAALSLNAQTPAGAQQWAVPVPGH